MSPYRRQVNLHVRRWAARSSPEPSPATIMLKPKQPSHLELYHQRKLKDERERAAFLPPGFINHGNTCFMNSVLQGVSSRPPARSPALTPSSARRNEALARSRHFCAHIYGPAALSSDITQPGPISPAYKRTRQSGQA